VQRISKFWVDAHTLPKSNPIWKYLNKAKTMRIEARSMHMSPAMLMRIHVLRSIEEQETIEAFAIAPWQCGLRRTVRLIPDRDRAAQQCLNARGTELQIFTDSSMRNGRVGCSLAVVTEDTVQEEATLTVGNDEMINVYIAELGAITEATEWAA
jgi:hypothetical protein